MESPKIEWYSKTGSDEKFAQDNDIYAGTYTKGHPISVDMQLWNNRWGTEDVEPLEDFYINMYFKDKEDVSLFEFCTVVFNGGDILGMERTEDKMTLVFPKAVTISGKKNDGTSKNSSNNFISLQFIFQAGEAELKEHDLKSLYLEIIKND